MLHSQALSLFFSLIAFATQNVAEQNGVVAMPAGYASFSNVFAPPPNDDFANAFLIPPLPQGQLFGTCNSATIDPAPLPFPYIGECVWYRFVAPHNGSLVIRLASTVENDPYRRNFSFARRTSAGSIVESSSQHKDFYSHWGTVGGVSLNADEEVFLAVWNNTQDTSRSSDFAMDHFFVPWPLNNTPLTAHLLEGNSASAQGFLWNSRSESLTRSLWWHWRAPADGVLNVRVKGEEFAAYTGTSVDDLKFVQSFRGMVAGPVKEIQVPVDAGKLYYLRLVSFNYAYDINSPFDWYAPTLTLDLAKLDLRFSTLRLLSPTNLSVFEWGAPVGFELAPVDTSIDGTISPPLFTRTTNTYSGQQKVPLVTATGVQPRAVVSNLFPALHEVQAVVTNELGQNLASAPAQIRVAPSNDNFTNAIELLGANVESIAIVSGSSTETGERTISSSHGSVWYRWRPTASGSVRVTFSPTNTAIPRVYSGTALSNLQVQTTGGIPFEAAPGTNYYIQILAPPSPVGTFVTGRLQVLQTTASVTAPTNHSSYRFAEPIPIAVSTTEASDRLAEVSVSIDGDLSFLLHAPDFQFTWTNAPPGRHQIIFTAKFSTGEEALRATNIVYVALTNDFFSNRAIIPFGSGELVASAFGATSENTAPGSMADLWYQWTSPGDGLLIVHGQSLDSETNAVRLYTGDSLTTLIAQTNRLPQSSSSLKSEWQVTSNTIYILALETQAPSLTGDFALLLDYRPRVANDAFAERYPITAENGKVDAYNTLATLEPGEPSYVLHYPAVASVWWTLTPPIDGMLEISHKSIFETVKPWLGDSIDTLTPVPLVPNVLPFGAGYYYVKAGTPLQISMAHWRDDEHILGSGAFFHLLRTTTLKTVSRFRERA